MTDSEHTEALHKKIAFLEKENKRLKKEALKNWYKGDIFFKSIAETINNPIFIKDTEGAYVYVNAHIERLFGLTKAEITGKNDTYLFGEEKGKEIRRTDLEVCKGNKKHVESSFQLKGERYVYEIEKIPLFDEQNTIIGLLGIGNNITKRKIVQEKLKENESKYRDLVNNSPTGIITINTKGEILEVNPALLTILGSPSKEATQKINMFTFEPLIKTGVSGTFKECLEKGIPITAEHPYISKWGKKSHLRYHLTPLTDGNTIIGAQATVEDFTSYALVKEKLEKSEQLYREITQNMLDMVSMTDMNGNFTFVSPAHTQALGYSKQELLQSNVFDFIHPNDKVPVTTLFMEKLAQRSTGIATYRYKCSNGKYIWLESKGKVLLDDKKEIESLLFVTRDVSERIKTEQLLKQNQEQLNSFINSTTDFVFLKDEQFKHILVNRSYADFMGLTVEEIQGKTDFELLPLELATQCRESDMKVINENKSCISDEYGDNRVYRTTKFPVKISENEIGVGAIIRDVTEEKNKEKAIRESEERHRSLLSAIPDIMFRFDFDGNFIDYHANDSSKLFLPPKNFLNKNVYEVLPRYLADLTMENINKLIKTGGTQEYAYELETGSKVEYYDTRMVKSGEKDVLCIVRDITKQTLNQQKLRDSETRFREFAELLPEIAFELDKEGNITFINKSGLDKFGYTKEDIEKNFKAISYIADEYREKASKSLKENLRGNHISGNEFKAIKKNGETFPCLIYNSPIKENNKITGLRGIMIDISQLKKSQKLENDIKVAERSSRIKQQFLANMSHEMRTPMNGIIGMTDFLLNTRLDAEQEDYVSIIKSSSKSLLYLINDILDISRIEQGIIKLIPGRFNIREAIDETMNMFQMLITQHDLRTIVNIDDDYPHCIYADENRFKQVISNLISNAIKYTPQGSININVLEQKREGKQLETRVEVLDTGIGIEEKDKDKVFSMFSRIDDTLSRNTEGTGLGLSISQKIVELMGGEIDVKSEPGKGSTFWFTFKAEISEPSKKSKVPSDEKIEENLGLKVLYAEDKLVNQKVIEMMLKNMGCHIDIVSNGKEALNIFKEHAYDVILMDIMMPEMDGITAMKELKRKYTNVPPIIGLSANAMEGDAEKYKAQGMDDYIVKPVNQQLLAKKLAKIKT